MKTPRSAQHPGCVSDSKLSSTNAPVHDCEARTEDLQRRRQLGQLLHIEHLPEPPEPRRLSHRLLRAVVCVRRQHERAAGAAGNVEQVEEVVELIAESSLAEVRDDVAVRVPGRRRLVLVDQDRRGRGELHGADVGLRRRRRRLARLAAAVGRAVVAAEAGGALVAVLARPARQAALLLLLRFQRRAVLAAEARRALVAVLAGPTLPAALAVVIIVFRERRDVHVVHKGGAPADDQRPHLLNREVAVAVGVDLGEQLVDGRAGRG